MADPHDTRHDDRLGLGLAVTRPENWYRVQDGSFLAWALVRILAPLTKRAERHHESLICEAYRVAMENGKPGAVPFPCRYANEIRRRFLPSGRVQPIRH